MPVEAPVTSAVPLVMLVMVDLLGKRVSRVTCIMVGTCLLLCKGRPRDEAAIMQRKRFDEMICPIARSLERVGEWWSILILRDAFAGFSRFEQFQNSLGIAPNMLSRRLTALVEA